MKLKTLLFLILIIGALCVIIFAIWPQFDVIRAKQAEITSRQQKVDEISAKNQRIADLSRSIDQKGLVVGFAESYIPFERNEERFIGAINVPMKADSGIILNSLGIEEVKTVGQASVEMVQPTSQDIIFGSSGDPNAQTPLSPSVIHNPRIFRQQVEVIGHYENIKAFLKRVYALDLMKDFSTMEITSAVDQSGTPSGLLSANFSIDFSYIPKAKISADYTNNIFNLVGFDFGPAEALQVKLTEKAPEISPAMTARENPFLP